MLKPFLEAGKIVGTHGIKGELRVECWCDSPEFLSAFNTLYFENGNQKLSVKSRPHKNVALVKIKDIDTVAQADLLRGKILYIDRNDVNFEAGVNFIQDIIGCEVKNQSDGMVYGKVTDVIFTGANDVYEVTDQNNKKYLIPVIPQVVTNVDVKNSLIEIIPMKGLFNDED